jgi:hypothetical protein
VVLYWQPIVPGWNDDPVTMAGVLATGRASLLASHLAAERP